MKLAELERAVQRHVLDGGPTPAALTAAVAAPAEERWQIYVDGYRLRLAEVLGVQYPALAARCGREAFDALCGEFIAATPSVHRSIRDYGGELGRFLAAHAVNIEDELRAELAAFEWHIAAVFDAASGAPITIAELAATAAERWAGLHFRGVPCLRRLATRTNAVAVWRAAKAAIDAAAGPLTSPAAERVASLEWLVARTGLDTEFRSLSGGEAAALDRLLGGASFGELCASLAETAGDDAALQAASWLKGWLQQGLLERA